jgi:hypothetical protein
MQLLKKARATTVFLTGIGIMMATSLMLPA